MEMKPKMLALEQLFVGQNVRLMSRMNLDTLQKDIEAVGLQNPIQVWNPNGDKSRFEVLRGHRRKAVLDRIQQSNPEAYARHFAKGVACLVVSDIDANEAMELKVDHGNELSLSDPFELQLCGNMLFSAGKTEEAVILALAGLMDRISPMKASRRKELEAIQQAAEAAETAGEKLMASAKREEANKLIADYRRGMVQGIHNAYRCPSIVMAALASEAGGVIPQEFATEFLPSLTSNDVKVLWKAHTQDMTILENGRPKFNQNRPGPAFRAGWEKIVLKAKEQAASPDTVRIKAMSANDILKDVKEGKFRSSLACRMSAYHAGDKEVAILLPELDAEAYAGELVKAYNPNLWKQVLESAASEEKKLIEQDKATTVAAAPVTV